MNPEMEYTIMGTKGDATRGITIVASERREALQSILNKTGFTELLGQINGSFCEVSLMMPYSLIAFIQK